MHDIAPPQTLPILLGRSDAFFKPHLKGDGSHGITWDLEYLPKLIALLKKQCGDIPGKAAREIRLFDVAVSDCNAVVAQSGHDYEIGFFMGLRDCLFEVSNLVHSHNGFMTELLGPSNSQPARFASPLPGFENCFTFDTSGFPIVPVAPPPINNYPSPVDPTRLRSAQFYRLCAEQLIWLHEHAHVMRGHFLLMDSMSASASAMSESVPVASDFPIDDFTAFFRRILEHDADWQAYRATMRHLRKGTINNSLYTAALAKLSAAQQMIFSIFTIFSASKRSPLSRTHPHPAIRRSMIGRKIFSEFGESSLEMSAYFYGIEEWQKASAWMGWNQFILHHCPAAFTKDDLDVYFEQADTLLSSVDAMCGQGAQSMLAEDD